MNTPYGDQPWARPPQQPPAGGHPPYGPPPGHGDQPAPYGPPPRHGYPPPPGYGPPAAPPYGATADPGPVAPPSGSPPPYGGGPFPAYGAPPPAPRRSRTGLVIGLVAAAVALLLCIPAAGFGLYRLADGDDGTGSTGGTTSPRPDPARSREVGGAHKPLAKACAPASDTLTKRDLAIADPREKTTTIGSVALMFCSGAMKDGSFFGMNASVYGEDKISGRDPEKRAVEEYETARRQSKELSGTTRDLTDLGEKAMVRIRNAGGSSRGLEMSAVDGNLVISVRLSVSDMSEQDLVTLASDLVGAYLDAT